MKYIFESERLGFRLWQHDDIKPFIELGQEIEGLQFFSRTYTPEESYNKMCEHITFLEKHPYGFWAVDLKDEQKFIGTIGFNNPGIQAFFTPCLQIGWCLNKNYWNQGFATEGATYAIKYIKQISNITEIFSYTIPENIGSQRVMQKIGMQFLSHFIPYNDSDTYIVYHLKL